MQRQQSYNGATTPDIASSWNSEGGRAGKHNIHGVLQKFQLCSASWCNVYVYLYIRIKYFLSFSMSLFFLNIYHKNEY